MADWRTGLPYRPNVGICLINKEGLLWMGRTETAGPEIVSPGHEWQMPQGGIEEDEDILAAAKRELLEETAIRSVEWLAQTDEWWPYDFPADYEPTGYKLDHFCGQKQKWVAFRFTGQASEIDISADAVDEPQEFFEWDWLTTQQAMSRAMTNKRTQYERVFSAFKKYLA